MDFMSAPYHAQPQTGRARPSRLGGLALAAYFDDVSGMRRGYQPPVSSNSASITPPFLSAPAAPPPPAPPTPPSEWSVGTPLAPPPGPPLAPYMTDARRWASFSRRPMTS